MRWIRCQIKRKLGSRCFRLVEILDWHSYELEHDLSPDFLAWVGAVSCACNTTVVLAMENSGHLSSLRGVGYGDTAHG